MDAARSTVSFKSIINISIIVIIIIVVIVTVVKVTGGSVVMATQRTISSDVDKAVSTVDCTTRTLSKLVIIHAVTDDTARSNAST